MGSFLQRLNVVGLCATMLIVPCNAKAEQQNRARLVYERPDDVEDCPDGHTLRDAVSARLGYEPFFDDADQTVTAIIDSTEHGLIGRVELRDGDGELLGERQLESPGFDCREFVSALTLSIAMAIDPLAMHRRDAPQDPASPSNDEDAHDESAAPPDVSTDEPTSQDEAETELQDSPPVTEYEEVDRDRVAIRIRINAHGSYGAAPRLAFGVDLLVGIRWRFFSIGLEGRTDIPATGEAFGGQVKAILLHLSLVSCLHWRIIAGCAVVGGGALRGEGEGYYENEHRYLQYWTVGGRFAVEVPLVRWLLFHAHLDLLGAPIRVELTVDDAIAWRSLPINFSFGGGLSMSF